MPKARLIICSTFVLLALCVLAGFSTKEQPTLQIRSEHAPETQALTTRVVYVIRHADTLKGQNPDLSQAGLARAQSLAHMLQDESLAAVFVTNTNRSIQTGTPVATQSGIGTTIYDPFDAKGITQSISNLPGSNATLIVAHSNTVPLMISALGGPEFEDLEETEFDRFFAVVLQNGKHVRTLELRY